MWSRRELKERGKEAFKANYWRSVLCGFLLMILLGSATFTNNIDNNRGGEEQQTQQVTEYIDNATPEEKGALGVAAVVGLSIVSAGFIIYLLLKIFVFNPLTVGCYGFFCDNIVDNETGLDVLKSGFGNYFSTFLTLFLRDMFLFLWTLLLIIPGFIKMYSYRMVPYIIRDNPELSPLEVITRSRQIMDGNKWKAFVLDLSFIGWFLLGMFTFGLVMVFWTQPYKQSTNAALYLELCGRGRQISDSDGY